MAACLCCGENVSLKLIEQGVLQNRYNCPNCGKSFWSAKAGVKVAKCALTVVSMAGIGLRLLSGDFGGAIASAAKKLGGGDDIDLA